MFETNAVTRLFIIRKKHSCSRWVPNYPPAFWSVSRNSRGQSDSHLRTISSTSSSVLHFWPPSTSFSRYGSRRVINPNGRGMFQYLPHQFWYQAWDAFEKISLNANVTPFRAISGFHVCFRKVRVVCSIDGALCEQEVDVQNARPVPKTRYT